MKDQVNYYDLLNIKKTATDEEIKIAYRSEMKKWHPDKNKAENASEIASKLNEAKEVLLDPTKRKEYDEYLENLKNPAYDNLDKKQSTRSNKTQNANYSQNSAAYSNNTTSSQQTNTTSEENTSETKTYSKWQYFKLYLKYYNVPIFRKIIAVIAVFLETILCLILTGVNYIFCYIMIYAYEPLLEIFKYASLFIMLYIVYYVYTNMNYLDIFTILLLTFALVLTAYLSVGLSKVIDFFLNKVAIWISKLNMFLFKKSIGYKN